jgi:hypothetical protein
MWALEHRGRVLPKSKMGKAIDYILKLWVGLTRFLDDPRIPLDNNAAERALHGVVVGRKNHYGSRSKRGTEVAALFYTLFETAKLSQIDPRSYVTRARHPGDPGSPRSNPPLRPHLICLDSDPDYSYLCQASRRPTASTYGGSRNRLETL